MDGPDGLLTFIFLIVGAIYIYVQLDKRVRRAQRVWNRFAPKRKGNYIVSGMTDKGRPLFEHRQIAEQVLGRKLRPHEVVHHMNGRPDDNRIENLCVMSHEAHVRYHEWYDWIVMTYGKHPRRKTQLRKLTEDLNGMVLSDEDTFRSRISSIGTGPRKK